MPIYNPPQSSSSIPTLLSGALGQTVFVWDIAPKVIVIDETKTIRKLQYDGITANWTGTTTITLTQSIPQFEIYAIE